MAQSYLLEQLDLAACYWKWTAHQEQKLPWDNAAERQQRQQRFDQTKNMLAYRWVVCADGWKLWCADLKIDPDFLLREVPGYEAVQPMEKCV